MNAEENHDRRIVHVRCITCSAYKRSDGCWDIEARLIDNKPSGFYSPERGNISSAEALHEMLIRVTVNMDLLIVDAIAETVHSPYLVCGSVNNSYRQLIGLQIGPGFVKLVRRLFHGINGCAHINELIPQIATTAYQVLWGDPVSIGATGVLPGDLNSHSPVNGCHALRAEGEVIKKYFPAFYQGNNLNEG